METWVYSRGEIGRGGHLIPLQHLPAKPDWVSPNAYVEGAIRVFVDGSEILSWEDWGCLCLNWGAWMDLASAALEARSSEQSFSDSYPRLRMTPVGNGFSVRLVVFEWSRSRAEVVVRCEVKAPIHALTAAIADGAAGYYGVMAERGPREMRESARQHEAEARALRARVPPPPPWMRGALPEG